MRICEATRSTVERTLRDAIGKTPLTAHRMVRMVPRRNQSQSPSKLSGSQEELLMWTGRGISGRAREERSPRNVEPQRLIASERRSSRVDPLAFHGDPGRAGPGHRGL